MNATRKLAAFAVALAAVLGGGAVAGAVLKPAAPGGKAAAKAQPASETSGSSGMNGMPNRPGSAHGSSDQHGAMGGEVRGLAIAQDGLRLVIEDPALHAGQSQQLRFQIVDDHGRAVRDFEVEHTKRMHLIVVRRDLTGFQHLHPSMSPDGTWATGIHPATPGSYRVFADFARAGEPATLAGDLRVDGDAALQPLSAPARETRDGAYGVSLDSPTARAGQEGELRFKVTKRGRPVAVEPYLGADGHLVALREGDLAFLHVHPSEPRQGAADGAGHGQIRFESTFPTAGAYRLFLQFNHDGKVHTVAFTHQVR